MPERQFLEASAKERTAATIRTVEGQTSVEVVVTVRRRAALHLGTAVAFGVACALVGFLVMWFSPREYDVATMPLDVGLSFVLGVALCVAMPGLRRVLTPKRWRRASAERAAKAAFTALGIEKTTGHTGLLVYVALFERTVVLVPDTALALPTLSASLAGIGDLLTASVGRLDLEAFLGALAGLGPACAGPLPRQADDRNELCDDVV